MTPSFMGLMATMLPGVRPSISLASLPTASTSPVFLLSATMDGSLTTMPLPLAKTRVFAVPRSMARSDEKRLNKERRFMNFGDDNYRGMLRIMVAQGWIGSRPGEPHLILAG